MENNIVTATFNASHFAVTHSIYRYNYGNILVFDGIENLPEYFEVHFANVGDKTTITQLGHNGQVTIPDGLLNTGKKIVAYIYLHETAADGETVYKTLIPVRNREEPDDVQPTPEQQTALAAAIYALNTETGVAAEAAADAGESAEDAEAWAVGERGGVPVGADDPAYENNAKYYAEQAGAGSGLDYNGLQNKPQVNGVTLQGNKTAEDLGLASEGISVALKTALLQLATKVAYIDDNGQEYYDDLYDALYPPAELVSISAVFNQGVNVIYDTDSLDDLKPYLTVTASYDDSSTATVLGYTLSGTLTEGISTITVSYGGKTAVFTVNVTHTPGVYAVTNTLTGCTTSNIASSVTENAPYAATITATSGYTLSAAAVSITMGGTDITSTAYNNGAISIASVTGNIAISVTAVQIVVTSISAAYDQSGTVYDSDSLDSLKADLVVTATYSDSSTATVPSADYTLSGTLIANTTSTITVTYNNFTASFDVAVSHEDTSLYNWDFTQSLTDSKNGVEAVLGNGASRSVNGITFDGTAGACYVSLVNMSSYATSSFTVELDVTTWGDGSNEPQIIGLEQASLAGGRSGIRYHNSKWQFYDSGNSWRNPSQTATGTDYFDGSTLKFVCDYANGYWAVYKDGVLAFDYTGVLSRSNNRNLVLIGSNYGTATIANTTLITGARIYAGVV